MPLTAHIICEDARYARFLENELLLLGLGVGADTEEENGTSLYIAVAEGFSEHEWAELCAALPTGSALILVARDRENVSVAIEGVTVFRLRRPFALAALSDALVKVGISVSDIVTSPLLPRPDSDIFRLSPAEAGFVTVTDSEGTRTVSLSPTEQVLFSCLWSSRGKVVPRDTLRSLVDGGGNTVEVFICHLRRKLETVSRRKLITTVRGVGYRLE